MAVFLALLLTPPLNPGAVAAHLQRDERSRAWEMRRQGRILPLPEIERRVLPSMRGARYLGPEIDPETGIYTLKFLRNGTVIWLRVDGRTGHIVERRGY